MQFSNLLSVVIGLLATAEAVSVSKPRIAARGKQPKFNLKLNTVNAAPSHSNAIQNFIIQNIITRSAVDSSNGTTIYDDSISCMFTFYLLSIYLIQRVQSLCGKPFPLPSILLLYI